MRKLTRLLAASALAASGIMAVTASPSLAEQDVIDCPSNGNDPGAPVGDPVHNPPVIVEDVPVLGDVGVGEGDACAELVRTLVFVGHADIDNGVNAAGVGGTVSIQGGDKPCVWNEDGSLATGPCDEGNNGGNFKFKGDCILVNWDDATASGVTGTPADCDFAPTTGFYTRPNFHGTQGGGGGGLFGCIENGAGGTDAHAQCPSGWGGTPSGMGGLDENGNTGLNFEPSGQASCTASDGVGTSTFISGLGQSDKWSSSYTWNNALNNLRGTIWAGLPTDQGSSTNYIFDAKIETQADPREVNVGEEPTDTTAAGCLEKTVATLNPVDSSGPRTGLNDILVVGTASWRVEDVPELHT